MSRMLVSLLLCRCGTEEWVHRVPQPCYPPFWTGCPELRAAAHNPGPRRCSSGIFGDWSQVHAWHITEWPKRRSTHRRQRSSAHRDAVYWWPRYFKGVYDVPIQWKTQHGVHAWPSTAVCLIKSNSLPLSFVNQELKCVQNHTYEMWMYFIYSN